MADEKTEDPFKGMITYATGAPESTSEAHRDPVKEEPKDEKKPPADETGDKKPSGDDTGDGDGSDDFEDIFGDGGDDDGGDDDADDDDGGDGDADDADDDDDGGDDDGGEDGGGEDGGDAENSDTPAEKKAKFRRKKKIAKARIAELTKYRRRAEASLDAERQRNIALEKRVVDLEKKLTPGEEDATNKEQSDQDDVGAPDPAKYDYGELDPKYASDVIDYRVDKRLAKDKTDQEQTQQTEAAERQAKGLKVQYSDKVSEGEKAYKDFKKVVVDAADNNEFPLTQETAMMALESPVGHHVIYKIAGNLKLAKKMASLPPLQQARAFGRLEAQFSSKDASRKKKTPNTTPPPKRRSGGSGISDVNPAKQSFADFEKMVEKSRGAKK